MISRRDFMKTAGVATLAVAAASALTGCKSNDTPTPNPDPAPDDNNNKPANTYNLGDAITVADGVTVTVTGKRYNYYNPQGGVTNEDFGLVILKVAVHNANACDGKNKVFDIHSDDFRLVQEDYEAAKVQYPLNVKAYGVQGIAKAETAQAIEILLTKFVGREDPAMDEDKSYVQGTPDTNLASYLVFLTNVNEAADTATLQYTDPQLGGKVIKINF